MATLYRHTQISPFTAVAMGSALLVALWWSIRVPGALPIITAVLVTAVIVLFSSLTIAIQDGAIEVFFGPSVIRRRIPLEQIADAQVVATPWYYGWGVRWTPTGWLWNVAGVRGVEIQLRDGRRFRVGSDQPEEVAATLRHALRRP
jgi:hypothetical protein